MFDRKSTSDHAWADFQSQPRDQASPLQFQKRPQPQRRPQAPAPKPARPAATKPDYAAIWQKILTANETEQLKIWTELGAQGRYELYYAGAFFDPPRPLSDADRATFRRLFFGTPKIDPMDILVRESLLTTRFAIVLDRERLTQEHIDRVWQIYEALPASHTEGNPDLFKLSLRQKFEPDPEEVASGRKPKATSAGEYFPGNGLLHVELTKSLDVVEDTPERVAPRDALYAANSFDRVLRHETGHAVDKAIGGSDQYCLGEDKVAGGAWLEYKTLAQFIDHLILFSNGPVQNSPQRDAVAIFLKQNAQSNRDLKNIRRRYLASVGAEGEKLAGDPLFDVLEENHENPWHQDDGGVVLNGRVFQKPELGDQNSWTSYLVSARQKKVSKYQFFTRREYWAELYTAYYSSAQKGQMLVAAGDAVAKNWFDQNVDNKPFAKKT